MIDATGAHRFSAGTYLAWAITMPRGLGIRVIPIITSDNFFVTLCPSASHCEQVYGARLTVISVESTGYVIRHGDCM